MHKREFEKILRDENETKKQRKKQCMRNNIIDGKRAFIGQA